METIGFGGTYYTLWYVYEKDGYVHYDYVKNISTDEEKAKRLYPKADIDMSLKGSHSFTRKIEDPLENDCFEGGMYKGTKFEDCHDDSYMLWWYNNGGSCDCLRQVLESRGYKFYDGRMMTEEEYTKFAQRDKTREDEAFNINKALEKSLPFTCSSSDRVRYNNDGYPLSDSCKLVLDRINDINIEYTNVTLVFEEYKETLYSILPCRNGKGVVVRNKNIEVTDYIVMTRTFLNSVSYFIIVNDFRIIKDKVTKSESEDEMLTSEDLKESAMKCAEAERCFGILKEVLSL